MVNFKIKENPYHLNINDLMVVGKRYNNEKRDFLFISKLLGKHIPVHPDIVKNTGYLLSSLKYDFDPTPYLKFIQTKEKDVDMFKHNITTNNKTLVIGFAETATALGMSVAASIKDSTYVCTTREILNFDTVFTFEEQHSHATIHKMYFNDFHFDEIILVDDEITTGKSMINLIRELKKVSSATKFTIFSILDWRNQEYRKMFEEVEKELGIIIETYALISGEIFERNNELYIDDEKELKDCDIEVFQIDKKLLKKDGKIGVVQSDIEKMEKDCEKIAEKITLELKKEKIPENSRVLVLGHGENIYIPSRISSYLPYNVMFKTTTRSPIYCDGEIIKDRYYFYDKDVKYYLYNKDEIEEEFEKRIIIY